MNGTQRTQCKKIYSNESYRLVNLLESLHAGGNWNNGANAGSQCRNANNYRWNTNTNISSQFLADPGDLIKTSLRKLLAEFINPVERQNTQRRDCPVSTV